jgi:hypothetical protein
MCARQIVNEEIASSELITLGYQLMMIKVTGALGEAVF